MAVPPAETVDPTMIPKESGSPQLPVHCTSTKANPIKPPARPPIKIATKANMRAVVEGSAESESGCRDTSLS